MPSSFQPLKIPGLILIEPKIFGDERGFFTELYKLGEFAKAGIDKPFVQFNHSKSQKNVLRGLHFQKNPAAQAKLVRVLRGVIWDVAVDIRKGSPTYGKWEGVELDAKSMKMLYIPEGFAHGFCALADDTEVEYFCTNLYSPEHERGILYNDPALGVEWPVKQPILSEKDLKYKVFDSSPSEFVYAV